MMRSEKFRQLLEAKGENPLLRFSLGQALLNEDQTGEAIKELKACAEGNQDWLMPRLLLGKAYIHLKDSTEARKWLNEARQLSIQQEHDEPLLEIERLEAELESI